MLRVPHKMMASAIQLISFAVVILGSCYASVPLYQLYCQTSGFGSTALLYERDIALRSSISSRISDLRDAGDNQPQLRSRQITVYFDAAGGTKQLTFKPTLHKIKVYPGDTALTFYIAHNKTNETKSGISTYHVSPQKVGIYFNKIQCFCFEEQRLKASESIEMPILFFIDPDFEKDPKMKDVDSITLSYTFFLSSTSLRSEQ